MKIYSSILIAIQLIGLGITMAKDEGSKQILISIIMMAPYHLLVFGVI